ncbi:ATP-dependent helicase HrpB [Rubritalea marina]|uniref:ATP-dependent helicase HrpB n=1 Tax=Rubritalea marina TaxID=361055 RepID=UPI00037736AC|nr:ATP-dependent helicase HrpB [Rubritalea marina]
MVRLPVEDVRNKIIDALGNENARLLLKAPTGSGKSTVVPQIVCDSGLVDGLIVVVQPRRIAARMLARRVASLRGVALGGEVGYVVRFDRKMSAATRVVFVTDGVLESWLTGAKMDGVGMVIFDEFHERRVANDISLALSLDMQRRQPLRVMVMSATLELGALSEYLGEECVELESMGRSYPVEVEYRAEAAAARGARKPVDSWQRCALAIRDLVGRFQEGHILVFQPGVFEINKTVQLIEAAGWARAFMVCPLYSSLAADKQDLAVYGDGSERRRIIISTNVAETSLTIDGVRAVVDAGTARVAQFDPVRGLDTLLIEKISRASAEQRAGRAGRTGPGVCVRLWSEADHARRVAFDAAEVQRVDLAAEVLRLKQLGYSDVRDFPWFEQPNEELLQQVEALLAQLGATDADGTLTELGQTMLHWHEHPRFTRMLIEGEREGCLAEVAFIMASVPVGDLFAKHGDGVGQFRYADDASDFVAEWRAFESARAMRFDLQRCQGIGVMARTARELDQGYRQIIQQCERAGLVLNEVDFSMKAEAISRSVLVAFSDRVAMRLGRGNYACRLVGKRRGRLKETSAVADAAMFVATQLTEVQGKEVQLYLDRGVAIDQGQLAAQFPGDFYESEGARYDEGLRRVVQSHELKFRDLIISSKDGGVPDASMASQLLAERVAAGELKLKKWDASAEQWIARLLCLREWLPELELPGFDEEDRAIAFEQICEGAVSYKEIKDREVMPALRGWLSSAQTAAMDHYAPTRLKLDNGREVKLKYELGKAPAIALQVQRLFGVKQTPTIADGKVKVLVNICAPNQRPWQMTQDLEGFWARGFEQMRKDLAGRYPKHDWVNPHPPA